MAKGWMALARSRWAAAPRARMSSSRQRFSPVACANGGPADSIRLSPAVDVDGRTCASVRASAAPMPRPLK